MESFTKVSLSRSFVPGLFVTIFAESMVHKVKSLFWRFARCVKNTIVHIATDPAILNTLSPICYILAVAGIGGWGIFYAIPFLYVEYNVWVTTIVQTCGCILGMELVINWLCLVFVDSTYIPEVHGGPPLQTYDDVERINDIQARKQASNNVAGNSVNNDALHDNMKMHPHVDQSVLCYFTWTNCLVCQKVNPPRSHHCVLCKKCILKRDHHCFVASKCIGFNNLRHFSVFLFYAFITTVFSIVHALPYAFYEVIPNNYWIDLFYPVTLIRGILGYIYYRDFVLIILGWMLLGYLIFSAVTLYKTYTWIVSGNTSYEIHNKIDIYDSRDLSGKLRAVYGQYWWLNFLFPAHFLFEPLDDPVLWPTFKSKATGEYFLM